jgi:hypothetical protein
MEASVNWKVTPKYAAAVFIAQFMLGFFEGLLFEPSISAAFSFNALSLVVCGAIFFHLGSHQLYKQFIHAWVSLFFAVAAGWVLVLILYPWFGSPNAIDVIIEYILLVCALVTGTSVGIMWQQKKLKEKA